MPLKIIFIGLQAYNLEKNAKHFSRLLNFFESHEIISIQSFENDKLRKKIFTKGNISNELLYITNH